MADEKRGKSRSVRLRDILTSRIPYSLPSLLFFPATFQFDIEVRRLIRRRRRKHRDINKAGNIDFFSPGIGEQSRRVTVAGNCNRYHYRINHLFERFLPVNNRSWTFTRVPATRVLVEYLNTLK